MYVSVHFGNGEFILKYTSVDEADSLVKLLKDTQQWGECNQPDTALSFFSPEKINLLRDNGIVTAKNLKFVFENGAHDTLQSGRIYSIMEVSVMKAYLERCAEKASPPHKKKKIAPRMKVAMATQSSDESSNDSESDSDSAPEFIADGAVDKLKYSSDDLNELMKRTGKKYVGLRYGGYVCVLTSENLTLCVDHDREHAVLRECLALHKLMKRLLKKGELGQMMGRAIYKHKTKGLGGDNNMVDKKRALCRILALDPKAFYGDEYGLAVYNKSVGFMQSDHVKAVNATLKALTEKEEVHVANPSFYEKFVDLYGTAADREILAQHKAKAKAKAQHKAKVKAQHKAKAKAQHKAKAKVQHKANDKAKAQQKESEQEQKGKSDDDSDPDSFLGNLEVSAIDGHDVSEADMSGLSIQDN